MVHPVGGHRPFGVGSLVEWRAGWALPESDEPRTVTNPSGSSGTLPGFIMTPNITMARCTPFLTRCHEGSLGPAAS